MRRSSALHVGLDVHANSIDVTVAEADAAREVRHLGSVGINADRHRHPKETMHTSFTRPKRTSSILVRA